MLHEPPFSDSLSRTGYLVTKREPDDAEAAPLTIMLEPCKCSLVVARAEETPEAEVRPVAPKQPSAESMMAWLAGHGDGATWGEWKAGTRIGKTLFNNRMRKLLLENDIYKGPDGRYYIMPAVEDLAEEV